MTMKNMHSLPLALCLFAILLSGCTAPSSAKKDDVTWPTLGSQQKAEPETPDESAEAVATTAENSAEQAPIECPKLTIAAELSKAPQFEDITAIKSDGILAMNSMTATGQSCRVENGTVTVDIALNFTAALGQAGEKAAENGQDGFYTYPYFLAVVDPSGTIVAKDVFAVTMAFKPTDKQVSNTENLKQAIVLPNAETAPGQYSLLAGFQLNINELDYVRSTAPQNTP